MPPLLAASLLLLAVSSVARVFAAAPAATAAPAPRDLPPAEGFSGYRGFSLLPKSFQKRPLMDFNILTEMTEEGRTRPPPTAAAPAYYLSQTTGMVNTGSAPSGIRRVPPVAALEDAMQKALAGASYLPSAGPAQAASLVIVFTYGSHAIDPDLPPEVADSSQPLPASAEEWLPIIARETRYQDDIVERAALIGGPELGQKLRKAINDEVTNININYWMKQQVAPVSPDRTSPFQLLFQSSPLVNHLIETAFHPCYFVVASAYDAPAMTQGKRLLLWRTKMTVDSQGVSLEETLRPLVASATPYFGRDMQETAVVSQRISREGKVEVGEATVIERDVPDPNAPAPAKP